MSITKQCELLGLCRSNYYYNSKGESQENLDLMLAIDKVYTDYPFYGVEKMTAHFRKSGKRVNPKRIRRLMRLMCLECIYSKPNLSKPNREHKKYPYLLRGLKIEHVNQVWSTDITYIPMKKGFMYLVAVIDWYSRYVLSWKLSNTLDISFCIEALEDAFQYGKPTIFNTDQGTQFTSPLFIEKLTDKYIAISMDGKGRATDNVFVERLWRSVKYEYVYLHSQETVNELYTGLQNYFNYYNHKRPHQGLMYRTPSEVYNNPL